MRRQVGAFLVALVLGAGLGALAGAGPAAAGGRAVTVIDPLPSGVEAGKPSEVSFWVLQHGTHPYNVEKPASIGEVGLTLTDTHGTSMSFPGRALAEPAHYVTTVTVPRDGQWRVTGVQGIFASFHVGTLTVPGTLAALGVPAAPSPADLRKYWPGPVRPPVLRIDQSRDPWTKGPSEVPLSGKDTLDSTPAVVAPAAAAPAVGADSGGAVAAVRSVGTPVLAVVTGGVVLVLGLALGGRRRRIRRAQATVDG